ncbi:MAG: aminomethyl-transferring glycine dehydrogenase subunit GcvPA [Actinomycetes bacterium]|jgi:glycine dehydrogenase subunit 1|nr:aminomethyl-transferring glycine dehydrogenase subunit GcvPA [Actinomycetes bacterium]
MNYLPITRRQQQQMLDTIGVSDVSQLYTDVPDSVLLSGAPSVAGGISEVALTRTLDELAGQNANAANDYVCFAGGGIYDHHRPAFIDHLIRRPEFFTAYTPYQPEVSQGTLQAIYEYQTGICLLTGLDVANASMYDGATALVEAAFMATRIKRGRRVVLASAALSPDKLQTLATYAASDLIEVRHIPVSSGVTDAAALADALAAADGQVAAVLLPYPNYYGLVADVSVMIAATHDAGALAVLDTNPIMLGVLASPGSLGADIAVGEGQPLGNAMSFGGPGLGYFACTAACMRQIPGRLVGRTHDVDGKRGYVLTLATREQHIRREKATSNICSNHALNALIAGMYLAATGPDGLRSIALDCLAKADYLREQLLATGLFSDPFATDDGSDGSSGGARPHGYEFTLTWTGQTPLRDLHDELFARGYLAGIITPDGTGLILATTEKRTIAEIDAFCQEVVRCA